MLDFRLDRHDKNQLELKLNYPLRPNQHEQAYSVEAFIFVPRVLSLTSSSYPKERFYEDTATFIRMTTPKVPLEELSSKSAVKPWAASILEAVDQFTSGPKGDLESAAQSLKLLGCIFKSAVRDSVNESRDDIATALSRGEYAEAGAVVGEFADNIRTALQRLRKVGVSASRSDAPSDLKEGWDAVDEYASLIAEEALTDLVALCEPHENHDGLHQALDEARTLAIGEYQHRVENGWSTFALDGERNEHLPHRWRVLKRYISSALYLNVSRDEPGQLVIDIIGMVAAAAAMLFATLAILAINHFYGASLSTAFLTGMVLAYVIKDRIKELGKRTLGRRARKMMPDHIVRIFGHGGFEVGTAKESFEVRKVKNVDSEIFEERFSDHDTHDAIDGRPETVLCYEKLISLSSSRLKRQFEGATGLTDIIRLNLGPMMARMDDAWETYRYIHPRTGAVQVTECARVYHINVLMRFAAHGEAAAIHRVRAIVNRKGIVRIEGIEGSATGDTNAVASTEEVGQIQLSDD